MSLISTSMAARVERPCRVEMPWRVDVPWRVEVAWRVDRPTMLERFWAPEMSTRYRVESPEVLYVVRVERLRKEFCRFILFMGSLGLKDTSTPP